eukprot:5682629-Amphidinium_carterae.1
MNEIDPFLARQIIHPRDLLLRPSERPSVLLPTHSMLAPSYRKLVERNVTVGLQKLVPMGKVWKHHGKPLIGGAFGIRKSIGEQRVISNLPVNQLLDDARVPRPRFAYPPRLRGLRTKPHTPVYLWKRDMRHYFHQLQIGRRWYKFLAHPGIPSGDGKTFLYPLHRAVPMGFKPAAGWAQAVSDSVLSASQIPQDRRVRFDKDICAELPVWGSIIDDIWVLEQPDGDQCVADEWLPSVEAQLAQRSIPLHPAKSLDKSTDGEFQGTQLHAYDHWLGVSFEKRFLLLASSLHLLSWCHIRKVLLARL